MPVPDAGFTLSGDEKTATLKVTNAPIIDQPRWPAMDAETTPAFLDFQLVICATGEPVKYENRYQQYRFEGFKANAQLEATVRVPSIDFTFKTDPLATSILTVPGAVTTPQFETIGRQSAFKTSTGAEVRFFMPVLNVPFRLIFAMNPQRGGVLDNDLKPANKYVFRFAVGSTF